MRRLVEVTMNRKGDDVLIRVFAPTKGKRDQIANEVGTAIMETFGWTALRKLGREMKRRLWDRQLFEVVMNDDGEIEVRFKVHCDDEVMNLRFANAVATAVVRTCGEDALRQFTAMNFVMPGRA